MHLPKKGLVETMKETIGKHYIEQKYSLHDAYIRKIKMKDTTITIEFKDGYYTVGENDCELVKGYLEFQEADLDFCKVYVLNTQGRLGKFKGRKYSLKKFVKKHQKVSMEIIDETYGYCMVKFMGWMYVGKKRKIKEFVIELYYTGSMKYIIEE